MGAQLGARNLRPRIRREREKASAGAAVGNDRCPQGVLSNGIHSFLVGFRKKKKTSTRPRFSALCGSA